MGDSMTLLYVALSGVFGAIALVAFPLFFSVSRMYCRVRGHDVEPIPEGWAAMETFCFRCHDQVQVYHGINRRGIRVRKEPTKSNELPHA